MWDAMVARDYFRYIATAFAYKGASSAWDLRRISLHTTLSTSGAMGPHSVRVLFCNERIRGMEAFCRKASLWAGF